MPLEMPLIPSKQLIISSAYSMILKRRGIVTTSFAFFNFLFYSPRYNPINAAPYTFRLRKLGAHWPSG